MTCTSADPGENVQSFKKTSLKFLRSCNHCLYIRSENDKVQKVQKSDKKYGKNYMKSTCTYSDYGENMYKIPKKLE